MKKWGYELNEKKLDADLKELEESQEIRESVALEMENVVELQVMRSEPETKPKVKKEVLVPVQSDSENEEMDGVGKMFPSDSPKQIDQQPKDKDMGVMPSAPTESFSGPPPGAPPPGTAAAKGDDDMIVSAVTGYDEGMNVAADERVDAMDEVESFLMGIGSVYVKEYYQLFMDQGFETVELIRTLTDDELKDEIGIQKMGHRRRILMECQKNVAGGATLQ